MTCPTSFCLLYIIFNIFHVLCTKVQQQLKVVACLYLSKYWVKIYMLAWDVGNFKFLLRKRKLNQPNPTWPILSWCGFGIRTINLWQVGSSLAQPIPKPEPTCCRPLVFLLFLVYHCIMPKKLCSIFECSAQYHIKVEPHRKSSLTTQAVMWPWMLNSKVQTIANEV